MQNFGILHQERPAGDLPPSGTVFEQMAVTWRQYTPRRGHVKSPIAPQRRRSQLQLEILTANSLVGHRYD